MHRLLFVHAHPDDETIGNGATMATYAAAGTGVTLVTCTRGEEGEVIPSDLGHLVADRDDRLGEHRIAELAAAMRELGVTDCRFLDELDYGFRPAHYRDSGMAYGDNREVIPLPDPHPDAFALVDVDEPAARLAALVRDLRPDVVATYEPGGGYGHPDHVQCHRVTMRAVELAAEPGRGGEPHRVPKVYWNVIPESGMLQAVEAMRGHPDNPFEEWNAAGLPSMVVPDALVTTAIDGTQHYEAKVAAMRAHATQISVDSFFFALSDGVGRPMLSTEFYRLVHGAAAGPRDADGRETDLLAGL
jgi:N-acetyl-1-D-myo-inositol-2-amino-2-deoxy-alpha-D-glucopyranoside deacetylase